MKDGLVEKELEAIAPTEWFCSDTTREGGKQKHHRRIESPFFPRALSEPITRSFPVQHMV